MAKKIAVIGTGYVGLVTGVGLSDFGHYVTCVDIDETKIKKLNKGKLTIYEPGLEEYFKRNLESGRLKFSNDVGEAVEDAEVVFIAVGTPPTDDGDVDLSFLFHAVEEIAKNLKGYKVIVTKSTVPVGTNREIERRIREIAQSDNFDVVSNPEFLREGHAIHDFFHPNRVVIGTESERARIIMKEVYRPLYLIETPFIFCNFETAELIKYASNAFLATKITFINQIANLAEKIGADVHVIAKAMGMDGRISPKFLHPGPGFGGSCLPKDIKALVKMGIKYNVRMGLIEEVIKSNKEQHLIMVKKLEKLLGDLTDKIIAALGAAFKAETDDIRESPALSIVKILIEKGAYVKLADPKAIHNAKRELKESFKKKKKLNIDFFVSEYDAVKNADAVIILTEWNVYRDLDLEKIKKFMRGNVILDTRNVLDPQKVKQYGFIYEGVGRK